MSRIVQLTAQNVKRLRAVTIRPDGHMVVVGGRNEQGKSSVLDSIAYAIGGGNEIPSMPIRNGQDTASIVLELDDLVIFRTFTAAGTTLVVKDRKGKRLASPQSILDRLTGKLTFDPLDFIKQSPLKQAKILQGVVGLDFADLEAERAKLFDERTLANREFASAKAVALALPTHADAPASEQSASEVITEIELAQARNADVADIARAVTACETRVTQAQAAVTALDTEILALEKQLAAKKAERVNAGDRLKERTAEKATATATAAAAVLTPIDPLKEKLNTLEAVNRKVRDNAAKVAADKKVAAKLAAATALTARIEALDADKAGQLAAAKFPIPGLSFTPDGVTFNGVPFAQAGGAPQMRASVAIAAAMNPGLKVMLIRDGSLLDDRSMALLGQLAEEHDLQVWIERVGKDESCSVVIEDGAVVIEDSALVLPGRAEPPSAEPVLEEPFSLEPPAPVPGVAEEPAPDSLF